jgi:hypothetical protein
LKKQVLAARSWSSRSHSKPPGVDVSLVRLDESTLAANEALFRTINERIHRYVEFLCGCGQAECLEHI